MTLQELLPLLHQLSRADKLRVLQYVATDLATEENLTAMFTAKEYEVWSPYDSADAARQLYALLEEEKQKSSE